MRNKPSELEIARDSALNDDFGLHRALRIIQLFDRFYGGDETTAEYLNELTDILIAVRQRARARHQDAEARRLAGDQAVAQSL